MRRLPFILGLFAAGGPLWPAAPPAAVQSVNGSALPMTIPGYELRVLDVHKAIMFNLKGAWVEASVPIFFYYPVAGKAGALRLLRRARDDLAALGRRREWTREDLRRVIGEVDEALRRLAEPAGAKS